MIEILLGIAMFCLGTLLAVIGVSTEWQFLAIIALVLAIVGTISCICGLINHFGGKKSGQDETEPKEEERETKEGDKPE